MSVSTEDKRVRWDWNYLQSIAETENLYLLTDRDIQALITPLAVMSWRTRILNAPTDFDLVNTFNATLLESLLTPMDFCALMLDCIENNEEVQEAIEQIIKGTGNPDNRGGTNPLGTGTGEGNILNGLSCAYDNLYGSAVAIVDYIEAVARDFIEVLSDSINDSNRIARAIDYTPILGDLPFLDDLSDYVDWIVAGGLVSFNAGYTSTMRQNLICALFEASCAECDLTPYDVLSAYGNEGGITINPTDVYWTLLGTLVGLTGDTAFAAGVCAGIAGVLASGSEVSGLVGLRGLTTIAASGNPDGDWDVFCNPCNTPIELILGYAPCAVNNVGSGNTFSLYGASPIDAAWTRYIMKPTANAASVFGYNFGFSVVESQGRSFTLKSVGFHANASGGADGQTCNGATYDRNVPSFGTTVTQTRYGVQIVTNTTSPTYYIDILVV